MQRHRLFVAEQAAWMGVMAVTLALFEALTPELFFVLSFVGMLYIAEYNSPLDGSARWRRGFHAVLVGCFAVFIYVVLLSGWV